MVQHKVRDGYEVVRGRRGVQRFRAGEEPFHAERVFAHIDEVRHTLAEPIDLQRLLVPEFAYLGEVVLTLAVAVGVERLRALVGRDGACHLFAKPLYDGLTGHVDPAPYASHFLPSAPLRVSKVLPMHIVNGGAFVLDLLQRRRRTFTGFDVRGDG